MLRMRTLPAGFIAPCRKVMRALGQRFTAASHLASATSRVQMPNTINATNPMATNSATSATESYSSQCRLRLPESI